MSGSADQVTQLLDELRAEPGKAADRIIPLIYGELRCIAGGLMKRERPSHTLQPTALVHEAWMRLRSIVPVAQNRRHFVALAAHSMRQILLDYARSRNAAKRGAGAIRTETFEHHAVSDSSLDDILAVNELLDRLLKVDPRQAQLIELRFFAGLSLEEAAAVMGLSEPTIKREWRSARAWLNRELGTVQADGSRTMAANQSSI
jgi:RNA polymerase sigma-70 factor (ECF subfamily)